MRSRYMGMGKPALPGLLPDPLRFAAQLYAACASLRLVRAHSEHIRHGVGAGPDLGWRARGFGEAFADLAKWRLRRIKTAECRAV